jgi:phage-related protein
VWNSIKSTVTSVVNALKTAVSTAFTTMWNGIKSTVTGIYNTIKGGFDKAVNFIKNLASSAFSWGADIINGIVNGIKSCISKVKDAVSDVAETIKSYLHFSVPDEGPLVDYESWMPDFMKGLADGIDKSRRMVADAVDGVASDMVISPQVSASQMALAGGGSVSSADLSSLVGAIRDAVSGLSESGNGGSGDIVIPVYLGGTMLDEVIVNAQQRANLRSGGR